MVGTPARSGQLLLTTGFTARSPSARPGFECWRERAPRSAEGSGHIRLCRRTTQGRRSGSGSVKISHPQVLTIARDALRATVDQLCCEYPYRDANELISEARDWLRHIAQVLRKPTSLREHRELLVSAGWLAALTACLEYDLGLRTSAQATRAAARQLAGEADHSEIMAWTYEMESWFALTQRRYRDTITEARAGEEVSPSHPVIVQLIAQEAKALGRMQDPDGVRAALDRGQRLLDGFPAPEHPEHHFVVDPSKWVFYAMDAYRMAGDDRLAEEYARQVLSNSIGPDGIEHAPMRIAEARLTLATVAARRGDLEQATTLGLEALRGPRKSLPSLLMMAGELDVELDRRYPNEPATVGFREALRRIHRP
jgi:hypothetical protein